ncbi:hypothetical protein COW46_04160 [Candidatus Gracilibacteria bacterium CG17_big_fil_post_rev_8_21_14_2_50_48_13]|nr:MAG: hypothetical protein COW46_04160 [Candidatus Gracilibacteria bacterium CG17_big_fil_post_rev_8_21_14_2_50_48_13]
MDIILLGIQGAGKGTQAEKLLSTGNYTNISIGEMLREKAKSDEDIAFFLRGGKLVPDEVVFSLIKEKIEKEGKEKSFIFDGMPRTVSQYLRLTQLLATLEREYVPVFFEITLETALERLKGRRVCITCHKASYDAEAKFCGYCRNELKVREDDRNIDSVLQRFAVFYRDTFPVVLEVIRQGNIIFLNADRDRDAIFFELKSRLDTHTFSRFNVF